MSSTGYYKRYEGNGWKEDCNTLIKPIFVGDTRIGYFITECRIGNKEGYVQFRPEMKKKFKDGNKYYSFIFGPDEEAYSMNLTVSPGKYFIQRAKECADSIAVNPTLIRYWNECLNNRVDIP